MGEVEHRVLDLPSLVNSSLVAYNYNKTDLEKIKQKIRINVMNLQIYYFSNYVLSDVLLGFHKYSRCFESKAFRVKNYIQLVFYHWKFSTFFFLRCLKIGKNSETYSTSVFFFVI